MKHTKLFKELMQLSESSEAFYSVDQVGLDGESYRIFLYRLGSYTDFMLPSGTESRGIMFRLRDDGEHYLVCRPPEKFFNMNENPLTMGLDYTQVVHSMVKEDGSLISSYVGVDGAIYLKTKGSLHSDQAAAAMRWLNGSSERATQLQSAIAYAELDGYTVNCEWTSPLNRIVVQYTTESLVVLNARNRMTGEYMDRAGLLARFGDSTVELLEIPVEEVAGLQKGEGIVVFFGNAHTPRFVKVKADAYLILHRLKDGVNQPNALFEAVIHEAVDDLRASFADDTSVQLMIQTMEDLVAHSYNHFCATIEHVFTQHTALDKKDFAIRTQAAFKEIIPADAGAAFTVAINRYIGRPDRMADCFTRSAQARIVAEYKTAMEQLLQEVISDE